MQLKSFFLFASLPVLVFAQTTPAQIESDISNTLATALAGDLTALEAFPVDGGTLDEAMAIHAAHITTNNVFVTLTNDIDNANCPLSDSDASTILTLLKAQAANLEQAFMDATAREPALAALGVISIFQEDFATLETSVNAFATAFGDCISANVLPEAEALDNMIAAAFASVIAAFNSS